MDPRWTPDGPLMDPPPPTHHVAHAGVVAHRQKHAKPSSVLLAAEAPPSCQLSGRPFRGHGSGRCIHGSGPGEWRLFVPRCDCAFTKLVAPTHCHRHSAPLDVYAILLPYLQSGAVPIRSWSQAEPARDLLDLWRAGGFPACSRSSVVQTLCDDLHVARWPGDPAHGEAYHTLLVWVQGGSRRR